MEIGSVFRITGGAFNGFEAKLVAVSGDTWTVEVETFGRATTVEIPAQEKAEAPAEKSVRWLLGHWWYEQRDQAPSIELYRRHLAYEEEIRALSREELEGAREEKQRTLAAPGDAAADSEDLRFGQASARVVEYQKGHSVHSRSRRLWWTAERFEAQLDEAARREYDELTAQDYSTQKSERLHRFVLDHGWRVIALEVAAAFPESEPDAVQVAPLDNAPDDFHWRELAGLGFDQLVTAVFQPVERHAAPFLDALLDRLICVLALRVDGNDYLLYAVENLNAGHYEGAYSSTTLLVGAPPTDDPRLGEAPAKEHWRVPASIAALYRVHNGFGLLNHAWGWQNAANAILPNRHLSVMTHMNDVVAEQNTPVDYDFLDLLEFYNDGSGNGRHFHRQSKDDADPSTVDWDHEMREIFEPQSFWDFLNHGRPLADWFGYNTP